jgi:hypothetical protein
MVAVQSFVIDKGFIHEDVLKILGIDN